MSTFQLGDDIRQGQLSALEQQCEMKQQVGGLADQFVRGLSDRGQCDFDTFLAD